MTKLKVTSITKTKDMFSQLTDELDKLEVHAETHSEGIKGKSLEDILIIAEPILVTCSTLFFVPKKARDILKALLKAIKEYKAQQKKDS